MKISNITYRNSTNIFNISNKNKEHQHFQKANIDERFVTLSISKKQLSNIGFNGIQGKLDKIGNLKKAKKQLDAIAAKREAFFKEYRSYFGNKYIRDYVRNYPKRGKFDPSNIAVLINSEYFRIISPSLVTGPYPEAKELKKLKQLGVTGILSVVKEDVEERTLECEKAGLKFLNFKVSDILASNDDLESRISPEEIAKKLKEFIDFINSNNVYMHCKLGRDRTGMAIALNNRYNPKQNFTVEMVMFNSDSDNISVDGLTPELIKKYGLRAKPDLQGQWKAQDEADRYCKSFALDDVRKFFKNIK